MSEELFDRSITPKCVYCEFCGDKSESGTVCERTGKPLTDEVCRHYRYDPLRRSPVKRPRLPELSPELFSLE